MVDLHWPLSRLKGRKHHLCSVCARLDLERVFCNETSQQLIGSLSEYNDPACPFCGLISKAIARAWGFKWDSASLYPVIEISCQLFIQSRSPLSIKGHGGTKHPQPRLLLATDKRPPAFHHNRAPPRQIDREKRRFIVAEIEALPNRWEPNHLPRLDVGVHANTTLLKRWLVECKRHEHSSREAKQGYNYLFQSELPFRLVDVMEECLVQKDKECDYLALSYVWGSLPTLNDPGEDEREIPVLLTLKKNMRDLESPKSLSSSRLVSHSTGRISRTIRDAMEFTRQMGMRYLWVDTLCIVQDDLYEKTRLIGNMDSIYNSATATIIAAAGSDADAGLRGISPRTGHPIEPVKIVDASDGTVLNLSLCLLSLCEEVRSQTWYTRGWAFQEQCLSRRCFYFTGDEVFFNCSEAHWREGYDYATKMPKNSEVKVRTGPPWWSRNLRKDLDPTPYQYLGDVSGEFSVHAYQAAVQEYSQKTLKFPHDIFDAFEGIFNRFRGSKSALNLGIRQAQAIPPHLLYQAILWFPSGRAKKRLGAPERVGQLADQFSTWSWYVPFLWLKFRLDCYGEQV